MCACMCVRVLMHVYMNARSEAVYMHTIQTLVSQQSSRPSSVIKLFTLYSFSSYDILCGNLNCAENMMFSCTVKTPHNTLS